MSQYFQIHPENPQGRLIGQAVALLHQGGVMAYPTDSGYALGCHIGDKQAADKIRKIRKLDPNHNFTLVCRDLSELGSYSRVDNAVYRLIRAHTPGPYTFILKATSEVPKRLQHPKRKTIGVRVPDNRIALALLESLGEPLMSVTLIPPGQADPLTDPEEIRDQFSSEVDLIIDGGAGSVLPTSIIDLTGESPQILRQGLGNTVDFV